VYAFFEDVDREEAAAAMTEEERLSLMSTWNAISVFISLWYLTGAFVKSAVIAFFVLGSCLLGFGRRWLLRAGFLVAILAVAVLLGVPHPTQWLDIARSAPDAFDAARSAIASAFAR
jgi:hypothetical protein